MNSKLFAIIIAGLSLAASASALEFENGKTYRIVSASYPGGTICLGSQHESSCYLYNNPTYGGTCSDAFWTFQKQNDGSYTIANAFSKQYITYSPQRIDKVCKGLILTDKVEGEESRWYIEPYTMSESGDEYCVVYTKSEQADANNNAYWNQRKDGTYLLGTYSYATADNSLFLFIPDDYQPGPNPPGPGPDPNPDPEPDSTVKNYTVIDGGNDAYILKQTGNRLTVIPKDYVEEVTLVDHTATFLLKDDYFDLHFDATAEDPVAHNTLTFHQVTFLDENTFPTDEEIPGFSSYKFNNKYNYQVPVDAEATDPTLPAFTLPVGGIGKWLTASFQFSHEGAAAWIGDVRQESKVTRQRFDKPMTYTIAFPTWQRFEVRDYTDPASEAEVLDIRHAYVPYGRTQTVAVDWLCDHPTSEYGVPRIDITLTDHPDAEWGSGSGGWGGDWGWDDSDYYWLGQDGKTTYVPAEITIDGGGTFPDLKTTACQIKGRGNSTWSQSSSSKNPYHFKFEKGQKPLGLTKGKHWVLLSNKQAGSMTTNAIGHRVADMMGGAYPCHIIPVDLYINKSYRGSYNLCERVGIAGNSVVIADDTYAAMVELDTYNDEPIYKDDWYRLSTKMKDPDFEPDYDGLLTPETVMADWESMLEHLYTGDDFPAYVDVPHLASYLAANEMIANCELKHAKSVFAYSENVTDGFAIEASADATPWVFGPLWDCDWAFGYEQQHTYFKASQTGDFFGNLISGGESGGRAQRMWKAMHDNTAVNQAYYYTWHNFVNNRLPELLDFCDEYYAFAARSLKHNIDGEGYANYDGTDYSQTTADAKVWLQKRADSVFKKLKTYPLPDAPVEPDPVYPDPDLDVAVQGALADILLGIDSVIADHGADTPAYDLHGRRITSRSTGVTLSRQRKSIK